jgi:excisionase family DNA binding protein
MSDDLIDLGEWMALTRAAQLLDLHTGTLRRWIREGRLRAKKRGRFWFVRRDEVRALLREPESKPRSKPVIPTGAVQTPEWCKEVLRRARI